MDKEDLMLDIDVPEIRFALDAVRRASRLVRQVQEELVPAALTKDDRSPVTVADFASQALVAHLLARAFPGYPLVGEEDSTELRKPESKATLEQVVEFVSRAAPGATPDSVCGWIDRGAGRPTGRFWTLDPIDGTKGFLRGDQYAVALALIENGEVLVGVLGCPNLADGHRLEVGGPGTIAIAAMGSGAWLGELEGNDMELSRAAASSIADPVQARILRSFESGHTNVGQIDQFAHAMGTAVEPVRLDSQAKYVLLAAGHGELYLRLLSPSQPDYREKIWDQAAGSLLITEAGGLVTDLEGKALDFSTGRTLAKNRGILASNGHLHPAALHALQAISA
jgi:3'(2'), 5'-bisphosphate nucleotidase